MYAAAIIGGVTVLILASLVKRMLELRATPWLLWPILLVAGATPAVVAWDVLHPRPALDASGEPIPAQVATEEGEVIEFQVPDDGDYSLMVTAILREYDPDDLLAEKTSYALGLSGKSGDTIGWKQNIDGVVRRDTASGGPDVALTEGDAITESGSRRGTFGEDLQDRFELMGTGETQVAVANWEPKDGRGAAEGLEFQIYQAPPSRELLWGAAGFVTLLCFMLEIRNGCDRVSNDVAFLMVWAVALRDGVTPLDDWQQIGKAMLPALLVGFLAVAGVSYVLTKAAGSRAASKEEGANGESADA